MDIQLDAILAKLDPKTRARVQSAVDIQIHKQPTPSIGLNLALNGGFAYGRQILVWGNKSAGKSSFCLQMIALAQKEGKTCAWIDAEHSYDPQWAEKLGVNSKELIYSPAKTINDMVDVATKLMEAGVDLIVVDSISALLPAIYFEKDGNEMKDLQDTKQIGAEAKDMTHAVKMLNYANKDTLLVLISQQRNQFGSMHASHIPTGGMAVKFFSSTVVKLWSSEAEANAIKAGIKVGDKIIEQRVGRPVNWIVDYNKVGPPNLSGQYDFYYQGEAIGIDYVGETLDVAEMCGAIEKGGAWYTINKERIQGRAKAVQYLRDNKEVLEDIKKEIDAKN
jgi:recombination protein RecA